MDYASLFVTKDDDSMNNNDRIQKIADEYKQEINSYDFREFALQIITKCGAVAFRKVEETLSQDFSSFIAGKFIVVDDVVFSADKKELVKYAPEKINKKYIIPSTTETVRRGAFINNEYIEDVEIPASVTHLGSKAFYNCKHLTQIEWSGAKTSGSEVFRECPKLKSVYTDNLNDFWNYGCDNLGSPFINGADLYVNGTLCEEIIVPNEVKGTLRAFKGCKSIKRIKFNADNSYIEKALLDIVERADRTCIF
jgi:hypothetical protein